MLAVFTWSDDLAGRIDRGVHRSDFRAFGVELNIELITAAVMISVASMQHSLVA